LKKKSSKLGEIPQEEQPFDFQEVKGRFINEVANYNVSFVMPVGPFVCLAIDSFLAHEIVQEDKLPANVRKSLMIRKSMTVPEGEAPLTGDSSIDSLPRLKKASMAAKSPKKNSLPPVQNDIHKALLSVTSQFQDVIQEMAQQEEVVRDVGLSRSKSDDPLGHKTSSGKSVSFPETVSKSPPDAAALPLVLPANSPANYSAPMYSPRMTPRMTPRLEPLNHPVGALPATTQSNALDSQKPLPLPSQKSPRPSEPAPRPSLTLNPPAAGTGTQDEEEEEDYAQDEYDEPAPQQPPQQQPTQPQPTQPPQQQPQQQEYAADFNDDFLRHPPKIKRVEPEDYDDVYADDEDLTVQKHPFVGTSTRTPTSSSSKQHQQQQQSPSQKLPQRIVAVDLEAEEHYEADHEDTALFTPSQNAPPKDKAEPQETEEHYENDHVQEEQHYEADHEQQQQQQQQQQAADYEAADFEEPEPASISVQNSKTNLLLDRLHTPIKPNDSYDEAEFLSDRKTRRNVYEVETGVINSADFEALVMSLGQMTHIMHQTTD
jgi:hypothetical protein